MEAEANKTISTPCLYYGTCEAFAALIKPVEVKQNTPGDVIR